MSKSIAELAAERGIPESKAQTAAAALEAQSPGLSTDPEVIERVLDVLEQTEEQIARGNARQDIQHVAYLLQSIGGMSSEVTQKVGDQVSDTARDALGLASKALKVLSGEPDFDG